MFRMGRKWIKNQDQDQFCLNLIVRLKKNAICKRIVASKRKVLNPKGGANKWTMRTRDNQGPSMPSSTGRKMPNTTLYTLLIAKKNNVKFIWTRLNDIECGRIFKE